MGLAIGSFQANSLQDEIIHSHFYLDSLSLEPGIRNLIFEIYSSDPLLKNLQR